MHNENYEMLLSIFPQIANCGGTLRYRVPGFYELEVRMPKKARYAVVATVTLFACIDGEREIEAYFNIVCDWQARKVNVIECRTSALIRKGVNPDTSFAAFLEHLSRQGNIRLLNNDEQTEFASYIREVEM